MTSSTCPTCGRPVVEALQFRRRVVLEAAPVERGSRLSVYVIDADGVTATRTSFPSRDAETFVVHTCPGKAAA